VPDTSSNATIMHAPRHAPARGHQSKFESPDTEIPVNRLTPAFDHAAVLSGNEGQLAASTHSSDRVTPTEVPVPATSRRVIPERLLGLGTWPLVAVADLLAVVAAAGSLGFELGKFALFGCAVVFLSWALGMYRSRLSMSVLDEVPRLICAQLGATAMSLGLGRLFNGVVPVIDARFLLVTCVCLGFTLVFRTISYGLIRRLRVLGIGHRTLIVGAGRVGLSVVDLLKKHPEYGLKPIGFVDSKPLRAAGEYDPPILGNHSALPDVLRKSNVRAVIIAFSQAREETMIEVIRECDRLRCEIFVVPRLFEVHHVSSDMDYAWSMPLSRLRRKSNRKASWRIKRLFDICSSAAALVLLSPILAVIALAVRLEGGPGVLFKQIRVGLDGTCFELLKFRSLRPVDETESATNWNISLDDRLGKVGRLLRKTSLDELPQLLNILRGDMSVVGPRPERPHFVTQFGTLYPGYVARHRVPCGLTGWAQIHGLRGDTSIEDRARFDNYYVENWSFWLDIKIILRTITSVITRAGS
jgi:exopolysaccharide biosynthesis polyprenyl glycosylphosphotransferase